MTCFFKSTKKLIDRFFFLFLNRLFIWRSSESCGMFVINATTRLKTCTCLSSKLKLYCIGKNLSKCMPELPGVDFFKLLRTKLLAHNVWQKIYHTISPTFCLELCPYVVVRWNSSNLFTICQMPLKASQLVWEKKSVKNVAEIDPWRLT